MKTITIEYLKEIDACVDGVKWWRGLKTTDLKTILETAIASNDPTIIEYGNWLICRVFTHEQKVKYAVFAARQVLDIYEKKHPEDTAPRKAIEAAEAYLTNPTANTAYAARAAADAAYAAAHAAHAADASTNAARAADASTNAARAAAYAAYAARAARAARAAASVADVVDAVYTARAAVHAADAAVKGMKIKILSYGLTLLEGD